MGSVPNRHAGLTPNMQYTIHSNSSIRISCSVTLFWYLVFGVYSSAKISFIIDSGEETVKTSYRNIILERPVKRISGHLYLGKIVVTSKVKG